MVPFQNEKYRKQNIIVLVNIKGVKLKKIDLNIRKISPENLWLVSCNENNIINYVFFPKKELCFYWLKYHCFQNRCNLNLRIQNIFSQKFMKLPRTCINELILLFVFRIISCQWILQRRVSGKIKLLVVELLYNWGMAVSLNIHSWWTPSSYCLIHLRQN